MGETEGARRATGVFPTDAALGRRWRLSERNLFVVVAAPVAITASARYTRQLPSRS